MKKPKPLSANSLVHPKDAKSSFNGDKIRPQESQGFMARRASQGLGEATESTNKISGRVRQVYAARPLKPLPSATFPVASRRSSTPSG